MGYLLDTDTCIFSIKRKPPSVFATLQTIPVNRLFISTISVAELQFGVQNSSFPEKNQSALDEFLAPFNVVTYDDLAAREFGKIKGLLKKQGNQIGSYDLLIASQARSNNFVLVSNNIREFSRVPSLEIANWV